MLILSFHDATVGFFTIIVDRILILFMLATFLIFEFLSFISQVYLAVILWLDACLVPLGGVLCLVF